MKNNTYIDHETLINIHAPSFPSSTRIYLHLHTVDFRNSNLQGKLKKDRVIGSWGDKQQLFTNDTGTEAEYTLNLGPVSWKSRKRFGPEKPFCETANRVFWKADF